MNPRIAELIILRGVPTTYHYECPDDRFNIGDFVTLPFGKATCEGLIIHIGDAAPTQASLKQIIDFAPKRAKVPVDLVKLIQWFQVHYLTTPYKALQTILSAAKARELPSEKEEYGEDPRYTLRPAQEAALKRLSTPSPTPYVLHGVTGSGKTEIYMQIAKKMKEEGKATIVLVPEIGLTPQFTKLFTNRFGTAVAVVHSGLTPKQKEIVWNKAHQGKATVILGPRSAVFSPVKNLGAIIIDEEHDNSYKQDSHPRYWTHTVARERCHQNNAILILGSATPSLESYEDALKHSTVIRLDERINKQPLPKIDLIDMKEHMGSQGLSKPLESAILTHLEKQNRVLILLNRRGYAPYVVCQKCGKLHQCPKCQMGLTYHQDKRFRCHRCFLSFPMTNKCSFCKKDTLVFAGIGTQKLELLLKTKFPGTPVHRLDRDNAKSLKDIEAIMNRFTEDGGILLGTQMIAKGHDFPKVGLVGVIGIDSSLNLPDFASSERTFQLITQVAGRAGRDETIGEVLVQTYSPDHYAIQAAQTHDFDTFYKEETFFREELNYPPYSELVHIICSSKYLSTLRSWLHSLNTYLTDQWQTRNLESACLGPTVAPVEKIKDHFRYHFVIKALPNELETIRSIMSEIPICPKGVKTILDFEAKSLL